MTLTILQALRVQAALIGKHKPIKKQKRKRKSKILNQPIYKT